MIADHSIRFATCLEVVLRHEGGFVDHPADRGGPTNRGITQKVYTDFCKASGRMPISVKHIGQDEIETIYHGIWSAAKCDRLPAPLDLLQFDAATNHGAARAIKLLQAALGVKSDGYFGPVTGDALSDYVATSGGLAGLCSRLLAERANFYDRIIANDPTQKVFAKGWGNRIAGLTAEVGLA